jgi:hypothetical protein
MGVAMRNFDYSVLPDVLRCNEIINLLTAIPEYKGKQELYFKPEALKIGTYPLVL